MGKGREEAGSSFSFLTPSLNGSLQGGTGEVHCEKVQCPRLACAQPVRANPTDCCKQCPGEGVGTEGSWGSEVLPRLVLGEGVHGEGGWKGLLS